MSDEKEKPLNPIIKNDPPDSSQLSKPEISAYIENLFKRQDNRRTFLKGLSKAIGIASISLPTLIEAAWCNYTNHQNYGNHGNNNNHVNSGSWTNSGGWDNYGNHTNGEFHVNCYDLWVNQVCHSNYYTPGIHLNIPQWCNAADLSGWCNYTAGGFWVYDVIPAHIDEIGRREEHNNSCNRPNILSRLPLPGCSRWVNGGSGKGMVKL